MTRTPATHDDLFAGLPAPPATDGVLLPASQTTWGRTPTEQATAQRDHGITRGQAKAERVAPGFADRACEFVLGYLAAHGETAGEVLVEKCKAAGIRSGEDRHFGCVFLRLSKRGQIVKAGFCQRSKGNNTAGGLVWRITEKGRQG